MTYMISNFKLIFFSVCMMSTVFSFSQEKEIEVEKLSKDEVAIAQITQAPYPDECEAYKDDSSAVKQCLSDYIARFVVENFKSNKFKKYPPKRYRISVQFKISKNGEIIDVLARGPYPKMEKEAIRTVKKIPRMNPGILEGQNVNVLYGLPINFIVPEKKKN